VKPSGPIVEADQKFLSDKLDGTNFLLHGWHSREHQPLYRRRLIASRTIEAIESSDEHPTQCCGTLLPIPGRSSGHARYIAGKGRHLGWPRNLWSVLAALRRFSPFQGGRSQSDGWRPLFHNTGTSSPEEALRANDLIDIEQQHLDGGERVILTLWYRQSIVHESLPSSQPRRTA